ncbi:MAG: hypothetical protein U9Q82_03690 [Chloroflexota bacterium]|nr:hypothetical protein [Chloroflexota bacterium]
MQPRFLSILRGGQISLSRGHFVVRAFGVARLACLGERGPPSVAWKHAYVYRNHQKTQYYGNSNGKVF